MCLHYCIMQIKLQVFNKYIKEIQNVKEWNVQRIFIKQDHNTNYFFIENKKIYLIHLL